LAASIEKFVRSLMLRHHLWQVLGVVLFHALVVALLLAVAAWLPLLLAPALWAGGGWLAYVLLRELLRLLSGRRRLQVSDVDCGLGLQDMLTTVLAERRHTASSDWLQREVSARLAQVPVERRRRVWWRACRRALVLMPLVVLAIWLGPLWGLLPFGLKPSGSDTPGRVATQSHPDGDGRSGTASKPPATPDPQPAEKPEQQPEPKPKQQPPGAKPEAKGSPQTAKPTPPKPLIAALPMQKEFVVPTWIHDGPSTKALSPVVDVDQPGRQPRPRRQPAPQPRARPDADAARQQLREFQRAAEQAQHARHVPPGERPFVRRYFGELVESGRAR